jgi:hypothetical protein
MAEQMPDCGSPIAYLVLEPGTAVYTSDHTLIGKVEHVLFVPEEDVFDGIVVETSDGPRFVDASDVDRIYERCVITSLTAGQAQALPPPEPGPPVFHDDPALGAGWSVRDLYLKLFRKGGWIKEASGEEEEKQEK